jgi:TrmH family RNA methyltransferase
VNKKPIFSRDNDLVKRARAVRDGKVRELVFVEGVRLCEEALRSSLVIENIIFTQKIVSDKRGSTLLDGLHRVCSRLNEVTDEVFASVSSVKAPEGIIALGVKPETGAWLIEKPKTIPLLVIIHHVNNPANAGAILRTAEAAGATGAILTEGTTYIFSPKALRGAMGSSFRLPLWTGVSFTQTLEWCARNGIRLVSTDLHARRSHTDIDWTVPRALIVGAEASGLTIEEMRAAGEAITIPMHEPVESLNVAVAAGIILYEAARQRAVGSGKLAAGS